MKQVIARSGNVVVADVPKPACPERGVLVRTRFSVISTGTESWTIGSTEPVSASSLLSNRQKAVKAAGLLRDVYRREGLDGVLRYVSSVRNPEVALGYSSAGLVVEVGKYVTDVSVGERVACAGENVACHAEFASVPRNMLVVIPENVSDRDASFAAIGAIAVHAVRVGEAEIGEDVCVIGSGLIGNLVIQVLSAAGCNVACVDMIEKRLELASSLGASLAVKNSDSEMMEKFRRFTSGRGFDKVFVCAATKSSEPLNLASEIARNKGKIIVVGRVGMEIERKNFYQKELSLLMSRSLGPGRYDTNYEIKGQDYPLPYVRWTLNRNMESFLKLVGSGKVRLEKLVSGEFDVNDAVEAYKSLSTGNGLSAVLRYGEREERKVRPLIHYSSAGKGSICTALVGPGGFARDFLIPAIKKVGKFRLKWVVSSNPLRSAEAARRFGFEISSCEVQDVIDDKEVELVIVASKNDTHAPILLKAMKAGKVCLIEKPLCISREEFEDIKRVQRETSMPVIVGFNRRYSRHILKLKEIASESDGYFIVNYRVNTGYLDPLRWSNDPEVGGGRILHECCHFIDVFNFLAGTHPPKIEVASLPAGEGINRSRDNIAATFTYPGGAVCNLIYTSLGNSNMGRERVELFAGSKSAVMDDFKTLTLFGREKQKEVYKAEDKGYEAEIYQLSKFIRREKSSIITTEEVFNATETTFRLEEAIRNQGRDK